MPQLLIPSFTGYDYIAQVLASNGYIVVSISTNRGTASLQSPPGRTICTITDRNTANNTCSCGQ